MGKQLQIAQSRLTPVVRRWFPWISYSNNRNPFQIQTSIATKSSTGEIWRTITINTDVFLTPVGRISHMGCCRPPHNRIQ
ncbi:hypothetical protein ABKN59_006015 [Abortiporus biennis]